MNPRWRCGLVLDSSLNLDSINYLLMPGYQEGAGMDSSRNGLLSTLLMTLPLIAVPAMALLRPPGQQPGVSTNPLEAGEDSAEDWLSEDLSDDDAVAHDDVSPFGDDHSPEKKTSSRKKAAEPDFDDIFENDRVARAPRPKPGGSARKEKAPLVDSFVNEANVSEDNDGALMDPFIDHDEPLPKKRRSETSRRGTSLSERSEERKEATTDDAFEEVPSTVEVEPGKKGPRADEVVEQLTARGAVRTKWFEAGDRYPVGLAVYFRGRNDDERIRFEAVGQTREECAADVLKQVEEWQGQSAPE